MRALLRDASIVPPSRAIHERPPAFPSGGSRTAPTDSPPVPAPTGAIHGASLHSSLGRLPAFIPRAPPCIPLGRLPAFIPRAPSLHSPTGAIHGAIPAFPTGTIHDKSSHIPHPTRATLPSLERGSLQCACNPTRVGWITSCLGSRGRELFRPHARGVEQFLLFRILQLLFRPHARGVEDPTHRQSIGDAISDPTPVG